MTTWQRASCLALLIGWSLAGPVHGADFNLAITASGIELGEPVMGPKLKADDLKGKVILLEFWGIN